MTDVPENIAKARFLTLQLLRLAGFVAAAAGIWLWRETARTGDPTGPGQILFVLGLVTALLLPALAARRWKSRS